MRLGARFLRDFGDRNAWSYTSDAPTTTQGEPNTLYFQLVDLEASPDGGPGGGKRYVPEAGATLSVLFDSIDDAKQVTRSASQPDAQAGDIWQVSITAADPLVGSVDCRLTLTEGSVVRRAILPAAVRIRSTGRQ